MKLLIADDHELFREGLRQTLMYLQKDITFLEAENFDSVFSLLESHPDMDLALLDLKMPGMDGFEAIKRCLSHAPMLPIMVLSASENRQDMSKSLQLGAMGYVPKSEPAQIILGAVQLVLSGGIYVPPILIKEPVAVLDKSANTGNPRLTPRQTEILQCIATGLSNKEIARFLDLSDHTIKAHVSAIFRLLNVKNRTQAILKSRQLDIIE